MSDKTDIAVLPPKESALQVFTAPKGLDPYLQRVRQEIDAFTPDVSTKKGRDAVASIAYKVAKSKTALDKMGKELVAELKEKPRLVDAERKRMRDMLDEWKDEVRRPLTEWENAEQARIEKHREFIAKLSDTENLQWCESAVIRELISETRAIVIDDSLEEFEAEAHRAKDAKIKALTDALAITEKREAEQAELERLRKEQAEREEADRLERIRQEAIEAERVAAKKAANRAHQQKINREALADMESLGIESDQAKKLIGDIARGSIRHITVNY